jgi:hypothetical protein
MRHSRISTTMDIYAQIVPTSQRRALEQLSVFAGVSAVPLVQQTVTDLDLNLSSSDAFPKLRSKTVQ